jgi:hypothetical protein
LILSCNVVTFSFFKFSAANYKVKHKIIFRQIKLAPLTKRVFFLPVIDDDLNAAWGEIP